MNARLTVKPPGQTGVVHESFVVVGIYVRPGASIESVGGTFDDLLCVSVRARAVDGKANDAVVKAVANALGLAPRNVELIRGHTNRRKVLRVFDETGAVTATLESLRVDG